MKTTKTPAPRRAGTAVGNSKYRLVQATRMARALRWDSAAIDALATLLERLQVIKAGPVRKTNQKR